MGFEADPAANETVCWEYWWISWFDRCKLPLGFAVRRGEIILQSIQFWALHIYLGERCLSMDEWHLQDARKREFTERVMMNRKKSVCKWIVWISVDYKEWGNIFEIRMQNNNFDPLGNFADFSTENWMHEQEKLFYFEWENLFSSVFLFYLHNLIL